MSEETIQDTVETTVQSSNLLEASGVEQEVQQQTAEDIERAAEDQQNWYLTEGVAGQGEKPEWLLPKYKSVADQAKAYTEAQKRLGGFIGAPKDGYDTNFIDEAGIPIDKESVTFNKLIDTARNLNMSQDALQNIMQLYADDMKARTPDAKAELEKLGPGGSQQLSTLRQWAENNLDKELYSNFVNKIQTAEDVKLMAKLRELAKEQPIPTAPGKASAQRTQAQIQEEILANYQRYETDKSYRAEKLAELEQVV